MILYRYGILDDEGRVIRWVWEKPNAEYQYVTERVTRPPPVDWDNFEEAPF